MIRFLLVGASLALMLAACGESTDAASDAESVAAPEPAPATAQTGPKQFAAFPEMVLDQNKTYTAVVTTNLGAMTFELLPQESPLATNNFVFLAREGYYDGIIVHRSIPGFMAQSGDPTGTGTGGPGYSFEIETPQRPYVRGTLAMANKMAPNTNGSQFFIIYSSLTEQGRLEANFSLFGQMTDGEETLAKIEAVPVGPNPSSGENSRPLQEIRIASIRITES